MPEAVTPAGMVRGAVARLGAGGVKRPLLISLLNQFTASGGNFLVGIYLARSLPLASFGLYGMGYGICMLYVGIGNAAILTQMSVNMAEKPAGERDAYAADMLCAVLLADLLLLGLASLGALAAYSWHLLPEHGAGLMLAVGAASASFLCTEFFISYAFQKRRESMALMVNATTMFVLFMGLLAERLLGAALTAANVLTLYAAGAALASLAAYAVSPLVLPRSARRLLGTVRESWRGGSWALGGVLVTWIQTQAYAYVVAAFGGAAAVGQANAARIFISPFSFLLPAVNKVAIPRLAELRCSDAKKLRRTSALLTAGMTALAVAYTLFLAIGLGVLSRLLLGRDDPAVAALVWPWCLVLVLQMIRSGGGLLLQIQRKFRSLTLISIPSAIVTVAVSLAATVALGAWGAILGIAVGEAVLALLIWREIRDERRSS
ncbi:MAG TPA: hypothetical protein VF450_09520 [Noviherbaspirillum sp.]